MEKITIINKTATDVFEFSDGTITVENVHKIDAFDKANNYFTMSVEQQLEVDLQEMGHSTTSEPWFDLVEIIGVENAGIINNFIDYISTLLGF